MGRSLKWRRRASLPELVVYRLGAIGLLGMMVLVMDYRSGPVIVFLYCYFWWLAVAVAGLAHQGLTARRSHR